MQCNADVAPLLLPLMLARVCVSVCLSVRGLYAVSWLCFQEDRVQRIPSLYSHTAFEPPELRGYDTHPEAYQSDRQRGKEYVTPER